IKPGVLAISSFTLTKNEQLDSFRTPSWLKNYLSKASDAAAAAAATTESERSTTKYIFPDIAELWKTNSRVNEILDCSSST
ncbi:unnamed protein product, partial [Rotaria magnacalcarata]